MDEVMQGAKPEQNPYSKAKILIVDDSEALRTMIKVYLEIGGFFAAGEVSDGAQAWDLIKEILASDDPALRQRWPDIALIDNDMPHLSGAGLIGNIRKIDPELLAQKGLRLPTIVGMSALPNNFRNELEAKKIPGASIEILPKPFKMNEFEHTFQTALESHFGSA